MRISKFIAAVAASTLLLAGCGTGGNAASSSSSGGGASGSDAAPAGSAGSGGNSDVKVGLAFDVGGRGDKSFNDAAAAGFDKAKGEFGFGGTESVANKSDDDAAREERLRTLIDQDNKVIIAVGFAWAKPLKKVASENPEVKFAIVDEAMDAVGPNISNLTFAEHEGSYLVGVAAALKSKANHIGFVGGVETPLIKKFEAGYIQGAKSVKADIKIDVKYLTQPPDFSGFGDAAKGKSAAEGMYQAGADVVYHAAGGSGNGVFEAAKAANKMAIGVDSDQYNTAAPAVKDVIITSMVKKVDTGVYDFLKSVANNTVQSGVKEYKLKDDGVGYSTSGGKIDDIKAKLEAAKKDIIDGKVVVKSKP